MKANTGTIIRKELARFFGDRALVFTTIIMPGLLIYLVYTLMGNGLAEKFKADLDKPVTMYVENMPQCMEEEFGALPYVRVDNPEDTAMVFSQLRDKEDSPIYVIFPADFDSVVALNMLCTAGETHVVPNVAVYSNSTCAESNAASIAVCAMLNNWESSRTNLFDVNAASEENPMAVFDMATEEDALGDILSELVPMLLLMLIVSGCMAVAPSAIAGEKERGTIATLLVTPLKRRELALGKILSLSLIAILSGLSSFLGIMLSLPNMLNMGSEGADLSISISYGAADYISLLLIILSTVLITISIMSILSALAKDVKNAGTMLTPFMLLVMAAGMSPMFMGDLNSTAWLPYLIPFYNSAQCMAAIFAREAIMLPVVVTVVANIVYMTIAVAVLTKMFNSEKVMFSR